jgi:DNA polymerase-3 subunit gamma/tau
VRESAPVAPPRAANGLPHWESLIEQAGLRGPFSVLAQNAVLRERDGNTLVLALQPAHMGMAVEPMLSQMEERISNALGERIKLRFVDIDKTAVSATPAARASQARDAAQAAAEQSIEDDPFVQSMKRDFGARVVPQSVKPFGN